METVNKEKKEAAVPDMYEAIKNFLRKADTACLNGTPHPVFEDYQRLREAMKKAEGK